MEIGAEQNGIGILLTLKATGDRIRLREEVAEGLDGKMLSDGMTGRWVQAYYLSRIVDQAGGTISYGATDEAITAQIQLPL